MSPQTAKALVLVVEDNEDVRSIITLYLRRNGFAVAEAADGLAALETAQKVKPDVILLDVLLPRLDGIEVLKRLRSSEPGAVVPVIMMSAVLQTRDLKAETARYNVSSFLQKPFQMRTVVEHVEKALALEAKPTSSPSRHSMPPAAPESQSDRRIQIKRSPLPPRGKLEDLPAPEILHSIYIESSTGQLLIYSGTSEKRIFFQNGLPVYAESSIPEETLGAHLMRRGRISAEQQSRALAEMTKSGHHFGEALLQLGLLGPHELFTELESHLIDKVISTFGWMFGSYQFEEGDSWKDDVIVARMRVGRILLDGIQRHWTPGSIQQRLHITGVCRTYSREATPYSEEQLGLTLQESRVLQMAQRGMSVGEIVRHFGDLSLVTATLYAFYVMEHIGFILGQQRDSETPQAPAAFGAAAQAAPSKDERAKALLAEYLKYRTADYFKLLGIARDASVEDISRAFQERQRRYHPDTLIGIDTGLVHEKIEELYVRIHNAYRTLIDPNTRQQYTQQLDEKMGAAPVAPRPRSGRATSTIQTRSEDVVLFEEGFSLLRNGEFSRALEFFSRAEALQPKPRYVAYRLWAAYLVEPQRSRPDAEQGLGKLHKENPEDALYPYLLGSLALKERQIKQATIYFERAVMVDPQHIDSARQLRILRMRQRQNETSGLFDLFKKK